MSTNSDKIPYISNYFEAFRKDVIAAIPPNTKYLLSVGCAAGATEAELIKQGIKVVGVERNPEAAAIARKRGLIVLEGDASEIDVCIDSKCYDCIVYADILEHLSNPLEVLTKNIVHLKTGGIIYVSIPNFRHWSVFWQLFIRGRIKYVNAGILDSTHLRITTQKMALNWFEKTNVEVLSVKRIIRRRRDKLLSACFFGLIDEFIAVQISLIGKKR